jgi:quercetin dioxygenase-like cupin family protein
MITRRQIVVAGAALAATASANAQDAKQGNIRITRSGSQPSRKGASQNFVGVVRVDSPFRGSDPARIGGAFVTFEPGARTAWHTHPLGQTLIVTAGHGWVQSEGGAKEEIRPGDIVWIPPGESTGTARPRRSA